MTAPRRTRESVERRANEAAEHAFVRAGVKTEQPRPAWMSDPSLLPKRPPSKPRMGEP